MRIKDDYDAEWTSRQRHLFAPVSYAYDHINNLKCLSNNKVEKEK